jgi:indolepyruvate ferredoxin oxidoreductase alpha subunit
MVALLLINTDLDRISRHKILDTNNEHAKEVVLRGEQALAKALMDNGVALAAGVYGDPCTSLLKALSEAGINVEITVEEKTAMAQTLGASVAGKRSVAVFKQVGVNVASDPLVNAATHGCGAGLLVIMGDDPGAAKSTTEQDSRWYAKLTGLPVLTPHNANHLCKSAVEGLELSETLGLPVLLQITARLTKAEDGVEDHMANTSGEFDRNRPWGRFMLDRHKYLYEELYPTMMKQIEKSKLHRILHGDSMEGAISCGGASRLVDADNHFALGYAYPLPEKLLVDFLKPLNRVLIVEEVAPVIEEMIGHLVTTNKLNVEVSGRLTGHMPRVGPLEEHHVAEGLNLDGGAWHFDVNVEPNDEIMTLPCGGFDKLYQALKNSLDDDHQVAGDVGCSILQGYFPPQAIDTAYALGNSIATAGGLSLDGRKGVSIIGDTGFLHSGITSLLNAVEHEHNLLVFILANEIPGMTPGHLAIPGLKKIQTLCEACGVDTVDHCDMDQDEIESLEDLIKKYLDETGVHVVIAKGTPVPLGG